MDVSRFTNGLGMSFVRVPPGEFLQGSPAEELGHETSEEPCRCVRIAGPLSIAVHPVTQARYQEVMGTNPSHFRGPDRPVECVSWADAAEFCRRLSEREGAVYRLPTEAEWEYACRAGTTTAYGWGDDGSQAGEYAWYVGNAGEATHEVGLKRANAWGLHDMHGNVWEWCADWYGPYGPDTGESPAGPAEGHFRVVRGGSYFDHPSPLRSASRGRNVPTNWADDHGFRVVLAQ